MRSCPWGNEYISFLCEIDAPPCSDHKLFESVPIYNKWIRRLFKRALRQRLSGKVSFCLLNSISHCTLFSSFCLGCPSDKKLSRAQSGNFYSPAAAALNPFLNPHQNTTTINIMTECAFITRFVGRRASMNLSLISSRNLLSMLKWRRKCCRLLAAAFECHPTITGASLNELHLASFLWMHFPFLMMRRPACPIMAQNRVESK